MTIFLLVSWIWSSSYYRFLPDTFRF